MIPLPSIGCAKAVNDYIWLSSDTSTVSVSASGIVQAQNPGKATIRVLSAYDSLNYDEVILFFDKFYHLGFYPCLKYS